MRSQLHSWQVYGGFGGTTQWQRQFWIQTRINVDLDRYALHYLDEIAGGIFGRKGAEFATRPQLYAIDMATQPQLRVHIDANANRLPRAHLHQLIFLEVRRDPDLRGDERQNLLADAHVIAQLDAALGHPAVL